MPLAEPSFPQKTAQINPQIIFEHNKNDLDTADAGFTSKARYPDSG